MLRSPVRSQRLHDAMMVSGNRGGQQAEGGDAEGHLTVPPFEGWHIRVSAHHRQSALQAKTADEQRREPKGDPKPAPVHPWVGHKVESFKQRQNKSD